MIRVALLVQPPVLRSLLARLLDGEAGVELLEDASGAPPDVVVVSRSDPENESEPVQMLLRSPRSRILALGADGRRAFLYELRPHRTPLGELSRESLLTAVRGPGEGAA